MFGRMLVLERFWRWVLTGAGGGVLRLKSALCAGVICTLRHAHLAAPTNGSPTLQPFQKKIQFAEIQKTETHCGDRNSLRCWETEKQNLCPSVMWCTKPQFFCSETRWWTKMSSSHQGQFTCLSVLMMSLTTSPPWARKPGRFKNCGCYVFSVMNVLLFLPALIFQLFHFRWNDTTLACSLSGRSSAGEICGCGGQHLSFSSDLRCIALAAAFSSFWQKMPTAHLNRTLPKPWSHRLVLCRQGNFQAALCSTATLLSPVGIAMVQRCASARDPCH